MSNGFATMRRMRLASACGAVLLQAAFVAPAALADEAYACEDGRVVMVRFGELEKLALTDPCIAAHLARRGGLQALPVAGTSPQPAALAPAAVMSSNQIVPPLPGRKPMVPSQKQMIPVTAAVDAASEGEIIIHNEAAPAEEASARLPRVVNITFPHVVQRRHRALAPQHHSVPVDFRNVPIINAAPGEPAVFHHTR